MGTKDEKDIYGKAKRVRRRSRGKRGRGRKI